MSHLGDASTSPESLDKEAIRRFERAWIAGRPEGLESLLPPPASPVYLATLEELVLIEMEFLWKAWPRTPPEARRRPPSVDDYRARFPALDQPEVLHRLAREERELRRRFDIQEPEPTVSQTTVVPGSAAASVAVPGYEIIRELGRGGMGVVYLARHRILNRLVALKMILAGSHATPEDRLRLLGEARHAAGLNHPHIVQVHEIGHCDGLPYLTLEFVAGGSLAARLRGQPLAPGDAARLMELLARGVHQAHVQGVVHRDLKPANVLIEEGPEVPASSWTPKVADFGLARPLTGGGGLTTSGAIVGTPSYMAPEQAGPRTGTISAATDVYALGAILYELLTGRPPFQAATAMEVLVRVLEDEPLPPARLSPRLPRDLSTICLKCLRKEPQRRYGSAADLAEELARFRSGRPIQARPQGRAERLVRWCRRNPVLGTVGAVAAVAAVAVVVLSIGFAWHQAWAAELLRRQQDQTETARRQEAEARREEAEARRKAEELVAQLQETHRERGRFAALSARLVLHQGQTRAEQGDIGYGMLVLARGLEITPPDQPETAALTRTALSAWYGRLHPLQNLLPHAAAVFSPDGTRVLSFDQAARLWDVATGEPLGPEWQHPRRVLAMAFSPDGRTVATGYDNGSIRLWDPTTGRLVAESAGHANWTYAVAFSPDGATLASGGADFTARLWNARTLQPIGPPLRHPMKRVGSVAFRPDGRCLLTTGDDGARLWDAATGEPVGQAMRHPRGVHRAVFSPDGTVILTGGGNDRSGEARLWDATGNPLRDDAGDPLPTLAHRAGVSDLAFRADGKAAVTACGNGTAQVWNLTTGQRVGREMRHLAEVSRVSFSPDGRTVLTGSIDWTARLWDAGTGEPLGPPLRHPAPVSVATFSANGQTILTAGGAPCRLWRAATARPEARTLPHPDAVMGLAFSPDGGTVVTGSWDGLARRWDAATGQARGEPLRHSPHRLNTVAFSPDGRTLLTAGWDGPTEKQPSRARLWDVATGQPTGVFFQHEAGVFGATFSRDGRWVLTGSHDNTARVWNAGTGEQVGAPLDHPGAVWGVAFSPDGRAAVTGGYPRSAFLWDLSGEKRSSTPLPHPSAVWGVAFSPDGTLVLTGCWDRRVRVWARATGKPVGSPLEHGSRVYGVAFSPDGRTVLTGSSDETARLWDARTGQPIGPILRHKGEVFAVAFSPDGRTIATAGTDLTDATHATGAATLWPGLFPLEGDPKRLTLWVQVLTGQELDDDGGVRWLDLADWQKRRQKLNELGGPPLAAAQEALPPAPLGAPGAP